MTGAAEQADSIFQKIMGRSGQFLASSFGAAGGGQGGQQDGNVTPAASSDSLGSAHGTAAAASAAAAFGAASTSYDMGNGRGHPSSSGIGAPGASADSTTPLEVGQGPASDQWPQGSHPGFFGKNSFAQRRRRGATKW